jgi:hypothetical protein
VIECGQSGNQVLIVQCVPLNESQVLNVSNVAFDPASAPDRNVFGLYIPDNLAASGLVMHMRYVGPTITIDLVGLATNAAVAGGDLDVDLEINGTPITDGTITIASGASAGATASAVPTAQNVLADGDILTATVAGGNTTAGDSQLSFLGTQFTT